MTPTSNYTNDRAASPRPGRVLFTAAQSPDIAPLESRDLGGQFVQHRELLYGYVFALTRDPDVAEEILQDVSVSVLTEAARGTKPENFLDWSRGMARHRAADYFRRQTARRQHELNFEAFADVVDLAFSEQPRTPDKNRDQLKLLRECMDSLSARVRSIIDLRYTGRQSLDSIAASVSWTPASVKVALSRARRTLADCVDRKSRLEEEGGG